MVDFYLDMLGAARFDFQIYSDGAQEAVAAGRAIIISTAGCMIASSSAFWWCSGFSFHDETAVANVGSLYHRATTYSLELYLPVSQDNRRKRRLYCIVASCAHAGVGQHERRCSAL